MITYKNFKIAPKIPEKLLKKVDMQEYKPAPERISNIRTWIRHLLKADHWELTS